MLEILQKIWKKHLLYLDLSSNFNDTSLLDASELAILLSANAENYERYLSLKDFDCLLNKIDLRADIYSIQLAQVMSINSIKAGFFLKDDIIKALELLKNLSKQDDMISFLKALQTKTYDKKTEFNSSFNELNKINEKLALLSKDEDIRQRLKLAKDKFTNTHFVVAITGVMNAGKSSMLNALLKNEILGVSNIPETANLTVLKYDEKSRARIYFWSKKEWQSILSSLALSDFLQEESKLYIKDEAVIKDISLQELKNFSSAKNQISALIKKIELFYPLDFLKDGIEIVDTPGLDDVFVQRELVTSDFVKKSDFLIHLMNASQSLSQKDSDFLLNAISNSRNSSILLLITKADLVDDENLKEVVNYTKNTLKKRLKERNLSEFLVEKVEFLAISSKLANAYYKGEASKEDFEKSSFAKLENYLLNHLFSSTKSSLILKSYKKELYLISKSIKEQIELENTLLKTKINSLDYDNAKLLNELRQEEKALKEVKLDIQKQLEGLEDNLAGLDNSLLLLVQKITQKLSDEVNYCLNKKQNISMQRMLSILDITFKDGLLDLFRELKFKNLKKTEELLANLALKYKFLDANLEDKYENFKENLNQNVEEILSSQNYFAFRMDLEKAFKEKDNSKLEDKIKEAFKSFDFKNLLENFELNKDFVDFVNSKLKAYESTQELKLKTLTSFDGADKIEQSQRILEQNLQNLDLLNVLERELL